MPSDGVNPTASEKFRELLQVRQKLMVIRNEFNGRVYTLREKKAQLAKYVMNLINTLNDIHESIPDNAIKYPDIVPHIIESLEYPEKKLRVSIPTYLHRNRIPFYNKIY